MKTVYLAGAITGESFGDATDWREYVKTRLNPGIAGLSPLRAKDYLENENSIGDSYEGVVLSCARGIMTRDFFDCQNCDVVLANLKGTEKVSIGTVMEIAWAYAFNKPLILVLEPAASVATGFRVETIDEAIFVANAILTDYVGK